MKTFRERAMELAEEVLLKLRQEGIRKRPYGLMRLKTIMREELSAEDITVFSRPLNCFVDQNTVTAAWKRLCKYPQVVHRRTKASTVRIWFNKIVESAGGTPVPDPVIRSKAEMPEGYRWVEPYTKSVGGEKIKVPGFAMLNKLHMTKSPAAKPVCAAAIMPAVPGPKPETQVIRPAVVSTCSDEASLRATACMLAGRTDPAAVVALGVIYTELGILAMKRKP